MQSLKVHNIVEYIKTFNEFPFEVEDVEEGLVEILNFFGIYAVLDEGETEVLKEDLLELALAVQDAEVTQMVKEEGW